MVVVSCARIMVRLGLELGLGLAGLELRLGLVRLGFGLRLVRVGFGFMQGLWLVLGLLPAPVVQGRPSPAVSGALLHLASIRRMIVFDG